VRTAHFKQSFFIRSLLVVMSLWYLFSPLHSEFNLFLHKTAHQFVIKDHHAKEVNEKKHHHHIVHNNHDFLASNPSEETGDHHENDQIEEHAHELISFFNAVFNKDFSEKNKKKHIFEHQIDKHILSNNIDLPKPVLVYRNRNLWGYYSLIESLEPDVSIPPPRPNLA